jgi:hypothetical protein
METLVQDDSTLLVIGHLPTRLTRKSLLTFVRANPPIPYIATSASADQLCENCGTEFLPWLQPSPSNIKEADSMLLFAKQQDKKNCLLVTDESSAAQGYSQELTKDIFDSAKSHNIRIVDTFKVGVGSPPSASDLQRLNPDCVLYAGATDIALTLWGVLPAPWNEWLLVSDGVIESSKVGELANLPPGSVFYAYATNAADEKKGVYADDAVGIARQLLQDLNRRGGDPSYRLRALIHFEGVQSARHNLYLVMRDNSQNRSWYTCSSGAAFSTAEGDREAAILGGRDILMMRNHGPIVVGPTVATAFDRLYYLEETCQRQLIAMSTKRPLNCVPPSVAANESHMTQLLGAGAEQHLAAIRRVLDHEEPDYAG